MQQTITDTEKLLTVQEVAAMLGISPAWVRSHSNGSRQPQIPAVRMGSRVRFRRGTVAKFIDDLEKEA